MCIYIYIHRLPRHNSKINTGNNNKNDNSNNSNSNITVINDNSIIRVRRDMI